MTRIKEMISAFIPSAFATMALVLSAMSNIWCETIIFEGEGNNLQVPTRSFGPFYRQEIVLIAITGRPDAFTVAPKCISYADGLSTDSEWKTTQAFAIITIVIGAIMVFWSLLSPCLHVGTKFWKQAGCVYLFCCLTQGLTLLFLQSSACQDNSIIGSQFVGLYPDTCSWGWGTKTNIASVVLWFVAGVLMCIVPPPVPEERPPPETQTVTYSETRNADGTITMTETGVVKGTYVPGEGLTNEIVSKEEQAVEP